MMTHYNVSKATDGKYYITVFLESKFSPSWCQLLPEAHETVEAAFEWANVHGLPVLEAQVV